MASLVTGDAKRPAEGAAKQPAKAQNPRRTPRNFQPSVSGRLRRELRQQDLLIRGQTQALRKVQVRAETAGIVAAIRADKGTVVKEGDTICELNVDARLAMLKQARATMKQRELEYEASKTLQEKGFRSETSVAGDLADTRSRRRRSSAWRRSSRTPRSRRPSTASSTTAWSMSAIICRRASRARLVVDQDPFLVVGQVSEKDVPQIQIGDSGWAKLITGERVEGKVRFVAKSSDPRDADVPRRA